MVDSSDEEVRPEGGDVAGDCSGLQNPAGSSLSGPPRKLLKYRDSSSNSNSNPSSSNSSSPIERFDDELLVEILHRVPCIKSATRCKCVCKRWLDLINPNIPHSDSDFDPYFVRRFMRRKYEKNRRIPFCLVNRMDHSKKCQLANAMDHVSYEFVTLKKNRALFRSMNNGCGLSLSFLPCEDPDRISILTSSNGLLVCCPSIYDHSVYFICNPVTKQWLALPPPPRASQKVRTFPGVNLGHIRVGLTFEEQDDINVDFKFNPVCKFRLVCVPAAAEAGEGVEVEVFSSETGGWTLSVLQRPPGACTKRMQYFAQIVVCNGIVYWLDSSVTFVGFNPWDNTCQFIPKPVDLSRRTSHFVRWFGQSRGFLWAFIFGYCTTTDRYSSEGKRFGAYVLKDYDNSKWVKEHDVYLNQLTSTPNDPWLDRYALGRSCYETQILEFNPNDCDVVYMRCRNCVVVQCNMRTRTWKVVDRFSEWRLGLQDFFPLMLPWWPTPVPAVPQIK